MELLYKIKDRVQQESIDYIEENRSSVVKNNQKTLFALNIIYFVVVVGYLLASLTVFSEWQVTGVYARAVAVHTSRVSTPTSNTPQTACLIGWSTSDAE